SVWAGPISLNTSTTVNVLGGQMTVTGVVSGPATSSLTKIGNGTLSFAADNTYLGATTATGGTLLVNGSQPSSPITVTSGATLGGIGTVGAIRATGGIVSPGITGPGILTATGNVSFDGASTFQVQLNGTVAGSGFDQLKVTGGSANLGGSTLSATLG